MVSKEESDITFDRIFLRGLIGLGESFDLFFLPPPPHMYIYKHHRICTDTGELIVAFIVAFAFSTTKIG